MAADPFAWVGHTLDGRYRALAVAGEGGFGVVYRGHHVSLDLPIAIKCLKVPQSLGQEERDAFERRFTEEGRVLHRLSSASAGVVQALDVGSATSPSGIWTPYLVLEWLDGRSLEDERTAREKRGMPRFSMGQAARLLTPAARALGEAHAQRVAHRDIKPANLFLSRVGGRRVLKVLDFGIAKVLHDSLSRTEALRMTGTSPPAFTPQYGAPEQFDRRKGATGPWTDVHALALVLVELVTGRVALEGDDLVQLMACALDRDHRPTPRALGVDVGDAVEAVLSRALALSPEDRYADANAFWDELLVACGDLGPADEETDLGPPSDEASPDAGPPMANLDTAAWLALKDTEEPEDRSEPARVAPDAPVASSEHALASSDGAPPAREPEGGAITKDAESAALGSTADPARWTPRWVSFAGLAVGVAVVSVAAGYALRGRDPPTTPDPVRTDAALPPADASDGSAPSPNAEILLPAADASAKITSSATAPSAKGASSGSSAPSASSPPRAPASTNAPSAEAIAPPDYCAGASCRVDGECVPTLVGKVVVCRAGSDADCKKTYGCTVHGACWARSGHCVATSAADCAKSQGCKETSECAFRNGKCLQELITDCTKYPICKEHGMCTAKDNGCIATSDAHCKASNTCARLGYCRTDGTKCVP